MRPHDNPMLRGRGAVYDDFIRWGSAQHVELQSPAGGVFVGFQQGATQQLVKARLDYPQTWTLFLFANFQFDTATVPNQEAFFTWKITLGTGNAQTTWEYVFESSQGAASTVEDFSSIVTPKTQIYKQLEFPAKDIQVVGALSLNALAAVKVEADVACYVAPRVLHGYGQEARR